MENVITCTCKLKSGGVSTKLATIRRKPTAREIRQTLVAPDENNKEGGGHISQITRKGREIGSVGVCACLNVIAQRTNE